MRPVPAWVLALSIAMASSALPAAPGPVSPSNAAGATSDVPVLEEGVTPQPGAALEDKDFGVRATAFGLARQVEMYQWRATADGYEPVWNSALIDSSDFDADHRNPPMPLDTVRWWAEHATLAGHPLDVEVMQALGEWRVFRPGFSRLPLNMAATFQPDGDGLGSAENPLRPQVGDLRIRWRELVLPPLQGQVVYRDGAWRLRRSAAPGTRSPADALSGVAEARPTTSTGSGPAGWNWTWGLLGLVALVALILLRRRRQR